MDVKFPLDNYLALRSRAASDAERKACAEQFKRDVQKTIKQVHERGYIDEAERTVDYAILFVPNERVLSFLNECDATAIDGALRSKVVICSPFTLYAVLVVVRQAMDNFNFARDDVGDARPARASSEGSGRLFGTRSTEIKRNIDGLQEAFDALATTRRRKLEGVLERIEALRVPDARLRRRCCRPPMRNPQFHRRMYASCTSITRMSSQECHESQQKRSSQQSDQSGHGPKTQSAIAKQITSTPPRITRTRAPARCPTPRSRASTTRSSRASELRQASPRRESRPARRRRQDERQEPSRRQMPRSTSTAIRSGKLNGGPTHE